MEKGSGGGDSPGGSPRGERAASTGIQDDLVLSQADTE